MTPRIQTPTTVDAPLRSDATPAAPRPGILRWLRPLLALSCLSALSPTPALANPVQTVDLAGTWNFTPVAPAGSATTIQVPGGGWYKQGFTTVDEADYARTITVPDIGQPQVTKIKFGAVNYQADLYVDNTFVASSTQAYTPATFDLGNHVTPGNSYTVRVRVKGMDALKSGGRSLVPNGAGSWCAVLPQGIFRSAELQVYPQVHIEDVFVKTSVTNATLTYDVWLRNASSTSKSVTLGGTLGSWNGDSWAYPALPAQSVTLAANTTTKVTVGPVAWNLGSASYWWPNVPYLAGYTAKLHNLNLSLSGAASHSTSVRFGFRECKQAADPVGGGVAYFLNGVRVNFRGDSFQGANYDGITYAGGKGDAFDTHPGFLPGANGWPKAVDNFQRLNYNVVRIHQIPASPYMLDVCDEMGLMLIGETGIRGAGDQQDFIAGHDNMVNHVKQLLTRDRNHASMVRFSISNEPDWGSTDSVQFQQDLYSAAMSVDGTRPLSIDAARATYDGMAYANFSVYRHYGFGTEWGAYTDEVHARTDRPYGQGEFLWDRDNTRQGFAWFATATQAMRAKNASDIRPYTLLSAWANVIPGVSMSQMQLEPPPWNSTPLFPLYGENNLPDPWGNAQIQRVQAGFHPVLVADADYWEAVKFSNANGDWPASPPFIHSGAATRKLTIYNDTFSDPTVTVTWEFRQGSPTGALLAAGSLEAAIPLGSRATRNISFTVPVMASGTLFHLVLASWKGGVELFREASQRFVMMAPQTKLSGVAFGATPSYSADAGFAKASDGDPGTYYDYAYANGGYTGIDLGAGQARRVSTLSYTPRSGFAGRMTGGVFQGSNDGANYTTFHTVTTAPSGPTTVLVNTYLAYRYLRYLGPASSYGNIAEMAFYTSTDAPLSGAPFGTSPAYAASYDFAKAHDDNPATFFDYSTANGAITGIDFGTSGARKLAYLVFTPRAGFESRMVGGLFQVSADGTSYTTLHTVATAPTVNSTTVFLNTPTAYRYFRYLAPNGSYGNIAEMDVYPSLPPAELWRLACFGTSDAVGAAADDADPDGDKVPNLLERALGGNPNLAEQGLLPVLDLAAPALSLVYRRALDATDLAFSVTETNDLSSPWTPAAGTSEVIATDGTIQRIRFTRPLGSDTKLFLRLEVTAP